MQGHTGGAIGGRDRRGQGHYYTFKPMMAHKSDKTSMLKTMIRSLPNSTVNKYTTACNSLNTEPLRLLQIADGKVACCAQSGGQRALFVNDGHRTSSRGRLFVNQVPVEVTHFRASNSERSSWLSVFAVEAGDFNSVSVL